VVGGGFDGPEWGQQPNTNMFSTETLLWASKTPQYTQPALLMKQLGVTTAAALGFAVSPSSSEYVKGFPVAAQKVGLAVGYLNPSLPFGTVDTTSVALAMKQAHVNGIDFATDSATAFAVITSAQQAGLRLKAAMVANGYGQSLLKQPTAVQAAQGAVFDADGFAPAELGSPATKAMQAAFQKYYNYSGDPDFGWYQGWSSMDLMIKGLEVAGSNPTRQSFISNLRQVTDYTAGGLLPAPTNFTQFGRAPAQQCAWYVKLEGHSFVLVQNNGQAVCGTLIPPSNQS
jgi:branched-chain amino acid transport system substrate-binding protein